MSNMKDIIAKMTAIANADAPKKQLKEAFDTSIYPKRSEHDTSESNREAKAVEQFKNKGHDDQFAYHKRLKNKDAPVKAVDESEDNDKPAFGKRDWDAESEDKPHDKFLAYKAKGGKLSRSQWEEDRDNGINEEQVDEAQRHAKETGKKYSDQTGQYKGGKNYDPLAAKKMASDLTKKPKKVDEAPSAGAMGRAAEREFGGYGQQASPAPAQAPQPTQRPMATAARKYVVKDPSGKPVGSYANAPEAVAARKKMRNPDSYSIVKEGKKLSESQIAKAVLDEAPSAGAMGRAAENEFGGGMNRQPIPQAGTRPQQPSSRKYLIKDAGGKTVSTHANAPEAVAARKKMRNPDSYSIVKEGVKRGRRYEIVTEAVKFRVNDPMLAKVLRRFPKEVADFKSGADLGDDLYDAVYDHYCNSGEMPYGTMKARDGDPYEWVTNKLDMELSHGDKSELAGLAEGESHEDPAIRAILDKYPHEAKQFETFGELDDGPLYHELFDHYLDAGEMPYGVAKARTGDPVQWVAEQAERDLGIDAPQTGDDTRPEFDSAEELSSHEDYAPPKVEGMGGDIMPMEDIGDDIDIQPTTPVVPQRDMQLPQADYDAHRDESMMRQNDRYGFGEDSVDPTMDADHVLVEDDEAEITSTLSEVGLDEGLDFFFENGELVVIGKSTASVAINALKGKFQASVGQVDGEEVRMNVGPIGGGLGEGLADDFADMARGMKNKDGSPRFNVRQGPPPVKQPGVAQPARPMDKAASSPADWYDQASGGRRNMGDSVENNDDAVNENVNLNITADGEDDVLAIIRKLSGLSSENLDSDDESTEIEMHPQVSTMGDMAGLTSAMDSISSDHNDAMDYENELSAIVSGEDHDSDIDEAEYANSPDPEVHTSTTQMINQGNDLNRPKKMYARAQPGDNPMAVRPMDEARRLMTQYEAMKNSVKK